MQALVCNLRHFSGCWQRDGHCLHFVFSLCSDSRALLACWQPFSAFSLLSNTHPLCSSLTRLCLQALRVVSSIRIVSWVPLYRKPGSWVVFWWWQCACVCFSPQLWIWTSNPPPNSFSGDFLFCFWLQKNHKTRAHWPHSQSMCPPGRP